MSVDCPHNCGKKVLRQDLETHVNAQTGDCDNKPCAFGCVIIDKDHAATNVSQHSVRLLEMVTALQGELSPDNAAMQIVTTRVDNIERAVDKIKHDFESMTVNTRPRNQPTMLTGQSNGALRELPVSIPQSMQSDAIPSDIYEASPALTDKIMLDTMKEKQVVVEGLTAVLNSEVEKLVQVQNNSEHQRTLNSDSIDQLKSRVTSIERGLALKDIALAEQDLRLQKNVAHLREEMMKKEGKLGVSALENRQLNTSKKTIPIENVSKKYTKAASGKDAMIYLKDLNTDIQGEGYTLAVYFYPNGVGSSTGQGVAFGFEMKKSPLDSILPWPFTGKITISLPQHDVEKCITPDRCLHGLRWERPQTDINEQYIIENFCPLGVLHNCEDDTALVRIAFEKFM